MDHQGPGNPPSHFRGRVRGRLSALGACVTLLLSPALASCGVGAPRTDESSGMRESQSVLVSAADEIQGLAPSDASGETYRSPSSNLYSCNRPETYDDTKEWRWLESRTVPLDDTQEPSGLLTAIQERITAQDGWKTATSNYNNGRTRLDLEHEDGGHVLVTLEDPQKLELSLVSACYYMPDYRYMDDFSPPS